MPQEVKYIDKKVGMVVYPIIAISFLFIANDNSFRDLIRIPSFYSDVFFAFSITLMLGIYLGWLTRKLDLVYSWEIHLAVRLKAQVFWGMVAPLFISMALETIYLTVIGIPIARSSMLHLELPLTFIFLLLVNMFYFINYLVASRTKTARAGTLPTTITVQFGTVEKQISIDECALILSLDKAIWMHTYDDKKYLLTGTLAEWEQKLSPLQYYRLNRQYLVSRNAIESVEQTDTRRLRVNFTINCPEAYVSKVNAVQFRQWWKNDSPF